MNIYFSLTVIQTDRMAFLYELSEDIHLTGTFLNNMQERKLGVRISGQSQDKHISGFKIFINSKQIFIDPNFSFSWPTPKAVLGALHIFMSEGTLLSKNSVSKISVRTQ